MGWWGGGCEEVMGWWGGGCEEVMGWGELPALSNEKT